ncbi:MAG TPA: T9SS type A sorting domain-containing protein [Flavobacteriaceae bacterium]
MNKNYFILLLSFLFGINQIIAESCPDAGTTSSGGTQIIFTYPSNTTSSCYTRPTSIEVNGTTTFVLDPYSCSTTVSVYDLDSGPAITGQDFTVTSGFDTTCSYSNGTLPVDDYKFLNTNLKVYPNPLTSGNSIKLVFGLPITAKLSIYNVTGKLVLSDMVNNQDSKEIDANALTNGIYMLKISTSNASTTRKVVIMK